MAEFVINIINLIIKGLGIVINGIINLLPTSPFQIIDNSSVAEFITSINWIIPVTPIMTILSAWVVCIAIYYLVMLVLRWVKAID